MLEFLDRHGLTIVTVAATAALIVIAVLAAATDGTVSTILSYVQAIAIIVAFPLLLWRSIIASRQAEAARRQAQTASEAERETRFARGVEMLAAEDPATRHAGVHTLWRLATESPDLYDQLVTEVIELAGELPAEGVDDG